MTPELWVGIIVELIASFGMIVGALMQKMSSKETTAVEALKAMVSAQDHRIDTLQSQVDRLEEFREGDREYIDILVDHINKSLPPPPPPRPRRTRIEEINE